MTSVNGMVFNLLDERGKFRKGEEGVCQVIAVMLMGGQFHLAADLPEISHYEREYPLPRGRADFVLFHVDGSVTVIEVKKNKGNDREIFPAIGQVMSYAVQLGYGRTATSIRKMVASDYVGAGSELIDDACRMAGVIWLPLGRIEEHEAPLRAAFAKPRCVK